MTNQPDRFKIPSDTLAIFPSSINVVYEQAADGTPILGILFDHKDLGNYVLWLSAEAAQHLAGTLGGILENPQPFKAEWLKQNGEQRNE